MMLFGRPPLPSGAGPSIAPNAVRAGEEDDCWRCCKALAVSFWEIFPASPPATPIPPPEEGAIATLPAPPLLLLPADGRSRGSKPKGFCPTALTPTVPLGNRWKDSLGGRWDRRERERGRGACRFGTPVKHKNHLLCTYTCTVLVLCLENQWPRLILYAHAIYYIHIFVCCTQKHALFDKRVKRRQKRGKNVLNRNKKRDFCTNRRSNKRNTVKKTK